MVLFPLKVPLIKDTFFAKLYCINHVPFSEMIFKTQITTKVGTVTDNRNERIQVDTD